MVFYCVKLILYKIYECFSVNLVNDLVNHKSINVMINLEITK